MNENVVVKPKNSKGLIALVIILLISVIGLSGFIIYEKTNDSKETQKEVVKEEVKEESTKDEKETIKIDKYLTFNSEIKKVYKGISNYPVDEQTSKFEEQTLYLYENGQYYLSVSSIIETGEIGYYEESDNVIILHSVFSHDAKNINYGESTGIVTSIYKESDDRMISSQIGDNDQFILEKTSVDANKVNQIKEMFSNIDEDECKKNYGCSQNQ